MPTKHLAPTYAKMQPVHSVSDLSREEIALVASNLTKELGEEITPEVAADYLAGWTRYFGILAKIDQRTSGIVRQDKQ